jgi:hypothetical protein
VDCEATKTHCQIDGCAYAVAINQCWGDLTNPTVICQCTGGKYPFGTPNGSKVCKGQTPAPPAPTSKPAPTPAAGGGQTTPVGACKAVAPYQNQPGITEWCNINCAIGYCPATHCLCSKNSLKSFQDGILVYQPPTNTNVYKPECQQYLTNGTTSMRDISNIYDTVAVHSATDVQFKGDFVQAFVYANPDLHITNVDAILPEGTYVNIPGDCFMSVENQSGIKDISNPNIQTAADTSDASAAFAFSSLSAIFATVFAAIALRF